MGDPSEGDYARTFLEGLMLDDEITPVVPPGVPENFNLVDLLSESMQSRPAWYDMARVASKVIYDLFEKDRIAFELSRDPAYISTVIKVITLKMLGLDWRSSNLTDDDYGRLVASISMYEKAHGPQDFVRYIGYALGVPMELVPLWTRDYLEFVPIDEIDCPTLWDDPPGPYYPTSHVGLLYEELSPNSGRVDPAELLSVFYKLAPINLVLEWVAEEVTLRVGPLVLSLQFYDMSEDTLGVDAFPNMKLLLIPLLYESSEDTLLLFPDAPRRELPVNMMVGGCDIDEEFAMCARPGVDWSPIVVPAPLWGGVLEAGPGQTILSNGIGNNVSFVEEPASAWRGWLPNQYGALVNPARVGYVPNSSNPLAQSWAKSPNVTIANATYPGTDVFMYTLATTLQAPISTTLVPAGTNVVTWTLNLESGGCSCVALTRGADLVVFDLVNLEAFPSVAVTSYGIKQMGSGFVIVWAVMTGGDVAAYPAWGSNGIAGDPSAHSFVWWFNLQVENSVFPSVSFQSGGTVPVTHAQSTFDLANCAQLNYSYGFALISAMPSYAEWALANQTLFDFRTSLGNMITAWVGTDGVVRFQIVSYGNYYTVATPIVAAAGQPLRFGFRWYANTQTMRLYCNSWSSDLSATWPPSFAYGNVLHANDAPITSQWTLQRVIVQGFETQDQLPLDSTMTWLFSPLGP